jgi:hypothetical protein
MTGTGRCCCRPNCEGCGRGQLRYWPDPVGVNQAMLWRFQERWPDLLLDRHTDSVPTAFCDTLCENRFKKTNDFPLMQTEWATLNRYTCENDGPIDCFTTRHYNAVRVVLADGVGYGPKFLRSRILRGKIYSECDDTLPERCRYLLISTFQFGYEVWRARTAQTVPCGDTLDDYPVAGDVPADDDWIPDQFTPGVFYFGDWTMNRSATGTGRVSRVTLVDTLAADVIALSAPHDYGVIQSFVKHQPECCDFWDCAATLTCTDPAEFLLTVESDDTANPCSIHCEPPYTCTTTENLSADVTFRLDGGYWGIMDND